ncbi:MAG: putative sensory/regulatory protein RpfC [Planctomycetota bacterium]
MIERGQSPRPLSSYLQELFDRMDQGVVLQSRDGVILDANPAAERILGLTLDQMQGRTSMDPRWRSIDIDGNPVPGNEHPAMRAIRSGTDVTGAIMGVIHAGENETRWLAIDAYLGRVEAGQEPDIVYAIFTDITGQRRATEAIAESEERLSLVMDATGDGVWDFDARSGLIRHNRRWCQMLGLDGSFMQHPMESFIERLHPDDTDRVMARVRQAFLGIGGDHYQSVHRMCHIDGTVFWVEDRGSVVARAEDGSVLRMVGSITDITERHRIQEELRRERDLFSEGPVLILVWSDEPGWPVRYVSANAPEILGFTREQLLADGFLFEGAIHPDDRERIKEEASHYLGSKVDAFEQRYRLQTAHRGFRHFHDVTRVERNASGQIVAIRGYIIDETEQIVAQQQVAAHQARLAAILEGTNVGTWEWNVQTGQTVFNERWAEMIGYTLDELSPTTIETWAEHCHPDDLVESNEKLQAHFRGETEYYEFEARIRHRDGHWIWVLDRGKVSSWTDSGEPLLMSGTHHEITAKKRAEHELLALNEHLEQQTNLAANMAKKAQEASLAKSRFLANMSHEIRTPMNGVIGMLSLLAESALDEAQARRVDVAKESAENLLDLLNDLLDLTKIEAGALDLERVPTDLNALVGASAEFAAAAAEAKGLEFEWRIDRDVPRYVSCDPVRLRQVLLNLLGNAVKFTNRGRVRLRVSLAFDKGDVTDIEFWITDTGIGIPGERIAQLFTPFSQVDTSTTRRYGGTGLGLAICKQLVDKMQGSIRAESEFGVGSTFVIRLPFPRCGAPVDAPGPRGVPSGFDPRSRLLLVEDNAINQQVALAILESFGLEADIAEDGDAAIRALATRDYDLVLMDCQMPVLDGYEATRRIRSGEAPTRRVDIPIIAMTAHAMAGDRELCLAVGMNDYLAKPIDRSLLATILGRWLPHTIPGSATPKPSLIHARSDLDGGALRRIAATALTELPRLLAAIQTQVAANDLKRVAAHAHTLKGAAANLGAEYLQQLASELEAHAHAQDAAAAGRTWSALADATTSLLSELRAV